MSIFAQTRRDTSVTRTPRLIGRGVTAGDGGVWGWVIIPGGSTDYASADELARLTHRGQSDLRRLIPPNAHFHIKVQWTQWTGDDYLAGATNRSRLTAGQRTYLELGARRIDDAAYPRKQVVLGVRFDDDAPDRVGMVGKAQRATGTRNVARDDADAVGTAMERIVSWQSRMAASSFRARPATAEELAWALRRDLRRTADGLPTGAWFDAGQMVRLRAGDVRAAGKHVVVETDEGIRLIRLVVPAVNGFPTDGLALPGGEWLKHLSIPMHHTNSYKTDPVEVSIRGVNLSQQVALKRLNHALKLAKSQRREAGAGGAGYAPEQVGIAEATLAARIGELGRHDMGEVEDTPMWVVEADTERELDDKTDALTDFYAGKGITLWAPPGIQDVLWQELILGESRRVTEFAQTRPWGTLVGSWLHGGSSVGAGYGYYLAENIGSTPGPFINRLSDAAVEGMPVTSVYVGKSGAGKSTAVMLSVLGEAVMGGWVLLTDLKGDLGGIVDVAHGFGVPVTTVSTAEVASGTLDPFRYVPDPQDAASRAIDSMVMALSVDASADSETHLRRAAHRVVAYTERTRSCSAIIDELLDDNQPAAVQLGERLQQLARDPLGRPVLGAPDLTAPQLGTRPGLVYMKFDDMRWPGTDTPRAGWKPGQRLTVMLVQAGFAYALYMAARVKGIPKTVALTELHYLTGFDFGREYVGQTAATGRALDVTLLLDTQAGRTLVGVPGLLDQVSQVHAFAVNTAEEADAQAQLLGVPADDQLRATQRGWEWPGQCTTRDRSGRVGPIQFDCMAVEIQEALDTGATRDEMAELDQLLQPT